MNWGTFFEKHKNSDTMKIYNDKFKKIEKAKNFLEIKTALENFKEYEFYFLNSIPLLQLVSLVKTNKTIEDVFVAAVEKSCFEILPFLIKFPAVKKYKSTALLLCVISGDFEMVKFLIKNGTNMERILTMIVSISLWFGYIDIFMLISEKEKLTQGEALFFYNIMFGNCKTVGRVEKILCEYRTYRDRNKFADCFSEMVPTFR